MNDVRNSRDDWQALADDWRQQPGSAIDSAALLQEVRRRGRRLRWMLASELATTAFVLGLCAWTLSSSGSPGNLRILIGLLVAIVLGLQAWALWIRRGQLRDQTLDAQAAITLDIRRTRTTLRYWRVSTWVAVAMWLALYAAAWVGLAWPEVIALGPGDQVSQRKLIHGVAASGAVGAAAAVWAWGRCRQLRRRLERMLTLRAELQED